MSRAVAILTLLAAGLAIAAPPPKDDPPWLLARLGNNRFRQFEAVSALTYSPDGKFLASADGETIHIWDASDGRRVRSIPIDHHSFFALHYTSDGRTLLAAAMDDRSTRLIKIDPTTGKVRANVAVRAGKTEGIFSNDGNWLVVRPVISPAPFRPPDPRESLVHVVNVATGNDWTATIEDGMVYSFAFKADGSALAVGCNNNQLYIFETRTGRLLLRHQLELKPLDLAFASDGKSVAVALGESTDHRVALFDTATGKELWSYSVGAAIRVAFVEKDKKILYFGLNAISKHPFCWFWLDAKTGKPTSEMLDAAMGPPVVLPRGRPISAIALSGDGKTMCQGLLEGPISQWDMLKRNRLPASCDPPCPVSDLTLNASQTKVRGWSGGWYGGWYEWDIKTGKQVCLTPATNLPIFEQFAVSPDGAWLARFIEKQDSAVHVELKNLGTGKIKVSSHPVENHGQLQFLPNDQLAVLHRGGITVFDPATGKRTDDYGSGAGVLRITSDGKYVVRVVRDESRVEIVRWSLKTGKIVSEWRGIVTGFGAGYREVASGTHFSPDGTLAVLQSEGLVAPNVTESNSLLVETATGKLRGTWGGSRSMGVRFTPDGRSLIEYNLRPFHYYMREVVTGGYRGQVYMPGTSVNDFAFSPDARKVIVSTQPYPIEIWDVIGAPGQWDAMKPDALWEALAAKESEHAYKSIRHLLMHPAKAVSFLKERVKVPESPDADWVKDRLKALDAAQFRDREKATADLAAVGELVLPALREAAKAGSEEAQSRLKPLIEKAEAMTPEKLRAIRACEVLEGLGTQEATALLETWARGSPGATLTREARESVTRIRASR